MGLRNPSLNDQYPETLERRAAAHLRAKRTCGESLPEMLMRKGVVLSDEMMAAHTLMLEMEAAEKNGYGA